MGRATLGSLGALVLVALALGSCSSSEVDEFAFDLGPGWVRAPIVNGWEYRQGDERVTVRAFVDPLMDQEVLFSQQTRRNIKENYEETYAVDDDHVYLTSLPIAGRPALVVYFADRSAGLVHRRQYYVVDGHRVFLIGTEVGPRSSQELDVLAQRFRPL